MTLQQYWSNSKASQPKGYGFTQLRTRYHAWAGNLEPVLHQVHVTREKVFVGYAGQTIPVHDLATTTV